MPNMIIQVDNRPYLLIVSNSEFSVTLTYFCLPQLKNDDPGPYPKNNVLIGSRLKMSRYPKVSNTFIEEDELSLSLMNFTINKIATTATVENKTNGISLQPFLYNLKTI